MKQISEFELFSENKEPTRMTRVESALEKMYFSYLQRAVELIEKPQLTAEEQRELDELDLIVDQLAPLVDQLRFEMNLRDPGYVGKLADFEA